MSPQQNTQPRTVLVIGATGRTGRHVVDGLLAADVAVRALVRHPITAGLPAAVTVVEGTLQDPNAVRAAAAGADAAFLLWPVDDPTMIPEVIEALTESVRHVAYLSAADLSSASESTVQAGIWAEVERALEATASTWTFLRGGGFAANTLEWAEQIRSGDTAEVLHPDAGRSVVDERDLAEAAVRALLDPSLAGRAYSLTGPATLTQREQVATIGHVLDRDLTVANLDPDQVREEYAAMLGADFADMALSYWATLVENPEPVTTGIEEILGRSPRHYEDWVRLHRADFERLTTAEVGRRYAGAFRTGQLDDAAQLLAEDVVRIAPLEDGGIEREVRGLAAIAENADRQFETAELESVEVDDPLVAGDKFALRFTFGERDRETGTPLRTVKLSLCTVAASRIIREEVFYYLNP
ncbi:NAD(P)H-binding protein [Ruania zhangjianzhongii]|uniref:NAD(P)H-binding protein n=1 Tax=Ruania zhangjianzhongii TaxID=2603206 RepID=UPI0011C93319|nr:NAD(P)H-binding protein [Ruania zhangjianzhongii]